MDRLKVEGHSGLERDANSKAIISTSRTTYESYMQSAMQRKSEKDSKPEILSKSSQARYPNHRAQTTV